MKRVLSLALALHLSAHAADVLPAHVTGSWSTAAPASADIAQTVLHLQVDGYGLLIGSQPAKPIDGGADGERAPRIVMGFPVRGALNGDTLRLQPFLPRGTPADQAAQAAQAVVTCRYDAAGPTFTCTGPDNAPFVLHREGTTLAPEVAGAVAAMKAQDAGT